VSNCWVVDSARVWVGKRYPTGTSVGSVGVARGAETVPMRTMVEEVVVDDVAFRRSRGIVVLSLSRWWEGTHVS
jgi:hypothetical protein